MRRDILYKVLLFFFVAVPGGALQASDEMPPVSLEFLGFCNARLVPEGRSFRLGVFRLRNNTTNPAQYYGVLAASVRKPKTESQPRS